MTRILEYLDPRRSLRARMALSFGGVALLFAGAGGLYLGQRQEAELLAQIGAGYQRLAFHFGSDLARILDERQDDLVFAASLRSFREARQDESDVERQREHFAHLQAWHPEFAWMGFADVSGRIRSSTGRLLEGADVAARDWFAGGRAATYFGDMHAAESLRSLLPRRRADPPRLIDIAVPVVGLDATPRGVIVAHLSDEWVRGRFAALKLGAEDLRAVEVMLVARDGTVLVSDGPAPPGMRVEGEWLGAAGGSVTAAMEGGRSHLLGFQRVAPHGEFSGFGWTVVARQDADLALRPAQRARDAALAIALLCGLAFAALGWLIATRIGRPLERMTEAAERLRAGGAAELPAMARADELGRLGATLRALVTGLKHDEALIRARESELANIVETMVEGVTIFDADGRITMINAAGERILGATRAAIVGRLYTDVPWRREQPGGGEASPDSHVFARMRAGAVRIEGEEADIVSAGGAKTTIQVNAAAIRDERGAFAGVVATYADISERKRAEARARAAQERLDRALEASKVALFEVDVETGSAYLSESWSLMRGGPPVPTHTTMTALVDITHPEERESLWSLASAVLRGEREAYEAEHRVRTLDGDWMWIISRARIVERAPEGRVRRVAGTNVDVTERKRAEQRIHYLNTRDALTDLSNRALFADRLEEALEAPGRKRRLALVALGLDRFTAINDSLGRDFGDEVLKAAAARIIAAAGIEDVVARPGGDEFLVLLRHIESPDDARRAAEAMRTAVTQPMHVGGSETVVTMSAGIAMYPEDGETAGVLLRNAGTALNVAKAEGGDAVHFFTAHMNVAARTRFETEAELRRALERDEFVLHFQPQVDLATHAIVGWEALVRWRHPERGLLPPAEFLPIAESSGLIVPLGERVLLKACRQAAAWKQAAAPSARVAINVSAQQFRHTGFMKAVRSALASTGLDPQLLEMEIVENALIGHEVDTVFEALAATGVELTIDDFGTGYSSLGYLKRLPIDTVKIDQSFVRDVPASLEACAIVHAVIAMAHGLGLRVIAEGIEQPAQVDFLRQSGCDLGQGFLFGRPEPPEHWSASAGNVLALRRPDAAGR